MVVADSPICASVSTLSTNLEEFIKIISIKGTKGTVCVSEMRLASCPACPPACPPAGYPHPGSLELVGKVGSWSWSIRSVTSLPDVQASHTKHLTPRGLGKVIYLKWEWQIFFLGYWEGNYTKEYERPQDRCSQELWAHPDRPAEKGSVSVRPSAGRGRGREMGPLALYLQSGSHNLTGEQWELGETKLIRDFSVADVTPFSHLRGLLDGVCTFSVPCILFSPCESTD